MVKTKRASKGHFICKTCKEEFANEMKTTKSSNVCKGCKEKEEQFKMEESNFLRYLMEYCGLDVVNGMIRSQFKRYLSEGYKVGGMKYTVYYCKEIEGMEFDFKTYGIGFIAYNYHKAQDYYNEQQRLSNAVPKGFKIKKKVVEIRKTKTREPRKLTLDLDTF